MWKAHELPHCKILLDSPLAISTTRIFARYPSYFDTEGKEVFAHSPSPFSFHLLNYAQTTEELKMINAIPEGNIIIAGSGMCTGGRIIHRLRHNLWKEKAGVIFVGFQARGTIGRQIIEGANHVNISGGGAGGASSGPDGHGSFAHAD
jgi:metallo-beta-lactamase family protein